MKFPNPDDLGDAPIWENYVVAQAVQASLGLIPGSAQALGVQVHGRRVRLHVQLSEASDQASEDIDDIVDDLRSLLGNGVEVDAVQEVVDVRKISPHDGIRWTFLARSDCSGATD